MKVGHPVSIITDDGKRRQGTILAITGVAENSIRKVLSIEYTVDGEKQQLHNVHHELDANQGDAFWLPVGEKRTRNPEDEAADAPVDTPVAFPEVPVTAPVQDTEEGTVATATRRGRKPVE